MAELEQFPHGVESSHVSIPELRLLQRYAAQVDRVLEIGTLYGFTCIGMALAGAHVTSFDPHDQGPADRPDTWEPFLHNVHRLECEDRVTPYRKPIEEYQPNEMGNPPSGFGMAFIDGDHVWPAPMRDVAIAVAWLWEPRFLAFHDVTPEWLGVWETVKQLEGRGLIEKLEQVRFMAVYRMVPQSLRDSPATDSRPTNTT